MSDLLNQLTTQADAYACILQAVEFLLSHGVIHRNERAIWRVVRFVVETRLRQYEEALPVNEANQLLTAGTD